MAVIYICVQVGMIPTVYWVYLTGSIFAPEVKKPYCLDTYQT